MDQVFLIIKGHEVYVGEYYKNEIRQVKFKDKDFWEVFDRHDFTEFIEHMNYPMNYNEFKNNKVRVLYDNSQKYEMLYQVQELFEKATDVKVGQLLPYIKKAYRAKCMGENISKEIDYLVYEQTYYKLNPIDDHSDSVTDLDPHKAQCSIELKLIADSDLNELDISEDKICVLTTCEVCNGLFEDDTSLVTLGEYYPVLAPVTLYRDGTIWEKQKFLETHHIIEEKNRVCEGKKVQSNDTIFEYTKIVNKLFGKKQKQRLQKKSLKEGIYYDYYEEKDKEVWADKGQLIGVVGDLSSQAQIEKWMEKTGYKYRD